MALEVPIVFLASDFSKFATSPTFKSWGQSLQESFKESIKGFGSTRFESAQHFESAQKLWLVVLDQPGLSAFELHQGLAKQLAKAKGFGKKIQFSIDLSLLKVDRAQFWVEALGVLSQTLLYEPRRFGVKENSSLEHHWDVSSKFKTSFEKGIGQGKAMCGVAHLADLPGNELKPASYQKRVFQDLQGLKKSQKVNLTWEFWDVAALKKKKAGAFLAVAAADLGQGAGILRAHYKPKEKSRGRFALVGKGLCFDTGGYNIKTGTHMQGMHQDMIGSAVALETFKLLVQENQPYELVLWMALAENHISPQGFKANDLVMSASGLSIEVVDTDAEGRMVLADALYFASGDEPTAIFDFATLTGACVRSLDTRRSGVFSNKREWLQRCVDVGERVGERLCSFPIDFDDFDSLRSEVADLKQCADHNNCDHIFAAAFLSRFVKESPWIHVDLSSGRNKGGLGLMPHATTGFGVRWTCQMIKELGR